jgi:hypothetical protein
MLNRAQKDVLMLLGTITLLNVFSVVQKTVKANCANRFLRVVHVE